MSALIKVTIRDDKGREVFVEVEGHQNEHASGLLKEACAEALKLSSAAGISSAQPRTS